MYLETPPMWQSDDSWEGFHWINPDDRERSILTLRRIDRDGNELIFAFNFTPVVRENYRMGVPYAGVYEEIFNSDSVEFGGAGTVNGGKIRSQNVDCDWLEESIEFNLPALGGCVFRCVRKEPHKPERTVKATDGKK